MKGCNNIRNLIDEAPKAELLSFEVTEHISQCGECEHFASERAALRSLLASGTRVGAPMNFDARLKERLNQVKGRRSFAWLGAPAYLKFGAATAGLIIMVFAAQNSGLFSRQPDRVTEPQVAVTPPVVPDTTRPAPIPPPPPIAVSSSSSRTQGSSRGLRLRGGRGLVALDSRIAPAGYLTLEEGGVVLVRGEKGDLEVPVPRVSVGAQPLLYVSAGQRPARTVAASF